MRNIWYWVECKYSKLIQSIGFRKDSSVIPEGFYCYKWDNEKNKTVNNGYYIIPCKYYRSDSTGGKACTFIGFSGFDPCLYDQCKICGENESI